MQVNFDSGLTSEGEGVVRLLHGMNRSLLRRFRDALDNPETAARARFSAIMKLGKGTRFGDEHGFSNIVRVDEFQRAVPIRGHEEFRPWLESVERGEDRVLCNENPRMFLETSGTTGAPKRLPVTKSWERTVAEAQRIWVLSMLSQHPELARYDALTVVSSAETSRSSSGLPVGSNTGRMHLAQPWWIRARYPVPYSVFCLSDAVVRQYVILRFALQAELGSITTANPSTVLLLCRRLREWQDWLRRDLLDGTLRHGPAALLSDGERNSLEKRLRVARVPSDWRPASIWPLRLVNCWKGGPARYFRSLLSENLGADLPVREVGITASEGYFALPLGDHWDGGVLWNLGHFMEFLLPNGDVLLPWQLEEGVRARLVITTEAGLYRYDLADEIEVIGRCRETPVIRFVGKAGRYLNATGEKVSEAQVSEAMRLASERTGEHPVGLTARIRWGERPRIELAMEGSRDPTRLVRVFDGALKELNTEYREKRDSERLAPPIGLTLRDGAYARFRLRRVEKGAPEGQVKDPIMAIDDAEWDRVCQGEECS